MVHTANRLGGFMDIQVTFVFKNTEMPMHMPFGCLPRKGETVEIPGFVTDGEEREFVVASVSHFIGETSHSVTIELEE